MINPPYYFDTLPIHPKPYSDESNTSYLLRLAQENGIRTQAQANALFFKNTIKGFSYQKRAFDFPSQSLDFLSTSTNCSKETLLNGTMHHLIAKLCPSRTSVALTHFFENSLSSHMRYCPFCLSEGQYYRLSWRFKLLTGCAKHECRLLDRCSYCKAQIPLWSMSSQVCTCPTCNRNLQEGQIIPLTEEELRSVRDIFEDLTFLLSYQTWENNRDILIDAGRTLCAIQIEHGFNMAEAASEANINLQALHSIHRGRVYAATFQNYVNYLHFLGINFRQMFSGYKGIKLSGKQKMFNFEMLESERKIAFEEELINKVEKAIEQIHKKNLYRNNESIAKILNVSSSTLFRYRNLFPRLNHFIAQNLYRHQ